LESAVRELRSTQAGKISNGFSTESGLLLDVELDLEDISQPEMLLIVSRTFEGRASIYLPLIYGETGELILTLLLLGAYSTEDQNLLKQLVTKYCPTASFEDPLAELSEGDWESWFNSMGLMFYRDTLGEIRVYYQPNQEGYLCLLKTPNGYKASLVVKDALIEVAIDLGVELRKCWQLATIHMLLGEVGQLGQLGRPPAPKAVEDEFGEGISWATEDAKAAS